MKRIILLTIAFVMMIVSLGGCFWWGYEGHGGRRGHDGRDEGRDRGGDHDGRGEGHDRDGDHERRY
jgi:hypothetical protein